MKAVISCSGMAMDTSWRAWLGPYQRFSFFASKIGSIGSPQFFFSFRPRNTAERLMSRVNSIRMVAMEKATAVSPRSLA